MNRHELITYLYQDNSAKKAIRRKWRIKAGDMAIEDVRSMHCFNTIEVSAYNPKSQVVSYGENYKIHKSYLLPIHE